MERPDSQALADLLEELGSQDSLAVKEMWVILDRLALQASRAREDNKVSPASHSTSSLPEA